MLAAVSWRQFWPNLSILSQSWMSQIKTDLSFIICDINCQIWAGPGQLLDDVIWRHLWPQLDNLSRSSAKPVNSAQLASLLANPQEYKKLVLSKNIALLGYFTLLYLPCLCITALHWAALEFELDWVTPLITDPLTTSSTIHHQK